MILETYTCRELRRRPARVVLTLLGIAIGVMTSVAIPIAVRTVRLTYRSIFENTASEASLEIVAPGYRGFDPTIVPKVESLDFVEAALPTVQSMAAFWGPSGAVPLVVLGVDIARDRQAPVRRIEAGDDLKNDGEVLLDAAFAASQDVEIGKQARFVGPNGIVELRTVGLLKPSGPARFGGSLALVPLATAQRMFKLDGQVNSVYLILREDASRDQAEDKIRKVLTGDLLVQAPKEHSALVNESLHGTLQVLTPLSFASLAAGAFVILNSFLMNLSERKRELAILRALGATRKQQMRWLQYEAAVLGLCGSVIGVPMGLAASYLMTMAMEGMMGVSLPPPTFSLGPIITGAVLGPGVSVLATWFPAATAARQPVLEALTHHSIAGMTRLSHTHSRLGFLGFLLLLITTAATFVVIGGWVPQGALVVLSPIYLVMFITGIAMVMPWAIAPIARVVEFALIHLFGFEFRMAVQTVVGHRSRTALVVIVITIGLMMSITFGHTLLNSLEDMNHFFDRTMTADFLVRGTMPDTTLMLVTSMPENLSEEISKLEGCGHVTKVNFIPVAAGNQQALVIARSWGADDPLELDLLEGEPPSVKSGLLDGNVVLGSALALRAGLGIGDVITVQTRQGDVPFKVVGVATEYAVGGVMMYMEWNAAQLFFGASGVHLYQVKAARGGLDRLANSLAEFCREHGLTLQSNAEFRRFINDITSGIFAALWALIILVFVIASLAVTNALTMNVLEQTRELGILRALGLNRRQMYKMIIHQALAIGLISLIPGMLFGAGMTLMAAAAVYPISGFVVDYQPKLGLMFGCAATALFVAVLASLFPARRAAKLGVLEALRNS